MTDYNQLRTICHMNREVSAQVIDEYLIYYAAKHDKLDQEMDQKTKPYRHILRKLPEGTPQFLKSQYIAHRIFKENGLIHKYLRHSEIQFMTASEKTYLKDLAEVPWRFSFSVIIQNPEEDFFQMEDVFSGETYLLYSPGMSKILHGARPLLWFNLIGFNGSCWQSFGPIAYYNGFQPDDIYFFATEMHSNIASEEELLADVEKNPVPYMMLLAGAEFPLIFKSQEQVICSRTECEDCSIDEAAMGKDFFVDHAGPVTRYGLKRWNSFPHFCCAYHDVQQKSLHLSAMTDKGYLKLVEILKKYDINAPAIPDIHVSPTMISATEDIFRKKIILDEYMHLFAEEPSPEQKESLNKLNNVMQMMMPDINAGNQPDYDRLARESGVDIETIKDLSRHLNETFKRMEK